MKNNYKAMMKKRIVVPYIGATLFADNVAYTQKPDLESQLTHSLSNVMNDLSRRFNVKFKYNVDTIGKGLPHADFRIRPHSSEESFTNVSSFFDSKYREQNEKSYKIRPYEYPRHTAVDGEKMLAYLSGLCTNGNEWEKRSVVLRKEVYGRLELDGALPRCVKGAAPISLKVRKYDGYTVQNLVMKTRSGVHLYASVYTPCKKGKRALIICPNGHFYRGRHRKDQQQRLRALARMGAVYVDYDLYRQEESEKQVGAGVHRTDTAYVKQVIDGLLLLDCMSENRRDTDTNRIGINGGSGGGTRTVLLSVLDERFTAIVPAVSLASHFDGGCPCKSREPIQSAGSGTCDTELAAMFASRSILVVSDDGDWTAPAPTLEYPYLQCVYGSYGVKDHIVSTHLPKERHDFDPNERNAAYDFFVKVFSPDRSKLDESKVMIEDEEMV